MIGSAPRRLRRSLPGNPEAVAAIAWFRAAMVAALRPEKGQQLFLSSWPALARYLQAEMGFADTERLRALFMDSRNRLLSDEIVAHGGPTSLTLANRHILGRALELGAAGLILVHNHPSGDASPSAADVAATALASRLCRALEIELHDHLIVARGRFTSMRRIGAFDP